MWFLACDYKRMLDYKMRGLAAGTKVLCGVVRRTEGRVGEPTLGACRQHVGAVYVWLFFSPDWSDGGGAGGDGDGVGDGGVSCSGIAVHACRRGRETHPHRDHCLGSGTPAVHMRRATSDSSCPTSAGADGRG